MIEVVGISFKNSSKIYYFLPNKLKLKKNITVIVETEKGLEFGRVELENFDVNSEQISTSLSKVLRIATKEDYLKFKQNEKEEKIALTACRKLIEKYNLNMVVLDAHYTFDRQQLIFRFMSDSRIDFRDLAKSLASKYKTRIELRQIGARDKAREVGGCGQCGQTLCCARFLKDMDSVSINMAKNQNIALNPSKINGVCGRLLCCLKYEDDNYKECKKNLPKVGSKVVTDKGEGKVISVDVLKQQYKVDVTNVGIVEVSK
ncbi:MAG: stage 0 sporulation protein [Firmicutes bacterium]|nr:stage 0 sporulation protein [Bacillota bacterium]